MNSLGRTSLPKVPPRCQDVSALGWDPRTWGRTRGWHGGVASPGTSGAVCPGLLLPRGGRGAPRARLVSWCRVHSEVRSPSAGVHTHHLPNPESRGGVQKPVLGVHSPPGLKGAVWISSRVQTSAFAAHASVARVGKSPLRGLVVGRPCPPVAPGQLPAARAGPEPGQAEARGQRRTFLVRTSGAVTVCASPLRPRVRAWPPGRLLVLVPPPAGAPAGSRGHAAFGSQAVPLLRAHLPEHKATTVAATEPPVHVLSALNTGAKIGSRARPFSEHPCVRAGLPRGCAASAPFPSCAWVTSVHLCAWLPRRTRAALCRWTAAACGVREVRCRESLQRLPLPRGRWWRVGGGGGPERRPDAEELSPAARRAS